MMLDRFLGETEKETYFTGLGCQGAGSNHEGGTTTPKQNKGGKRL